MMDPQQQPLYHPPTTYPSYIGSTPSSTQSSPQTYPHELDMFQSHYSAPNPYPPSHNRPPRPPKSASYGPPLHVSTTTTATEHDPNERTARPGNAHVHAQFHSQSLPMPSQQRSFDNEQDNMLLSDPSSSSIQQDTGASSSSRLDATYTHSTPGLSNGLTRPLKPSEQDLLTHLDRLKYFLATAPSRWDSTGTVSASSSTGSGPLTNAYPTPPNTNGDVHDMDDMGLTMPSQTPGQNASHPAMHRFLLPTTKEYVTCVLWNGLYHITGTDIVRALVFRFEAFGRPVRNTKKFEEGVFSDLRNLKPGVDACLEEPKSPFLDLLFKYQCIRTQKKQKVFYWFSVPHDRLFLDALERDLKREKMGQEPTTVIVGEPAMSFTYDPKRSLYEQFSKASGAREGEGELEAAVRRAVEAGGASHPASRGGSINGDGEDSVMTEESESGISDIDDGEHASSRKRNIPPALRETLGVGSAWRDGNPSYKMRKKKGRKDEDGMGPRGRTVTAGIGMGGHHTRYDSLSVSRERPGSAGMMDPYGPRADDASAADIFRMQARGELIPADGMIKRQRVPQPITDVDVYYAEGVAMGSNQYLTPPASAGMQGGVSGPGPIRPGHQRHRSYENHRHTFPLTPATSALSAGYNVTTFNQAAAQQQFQPQQQVATPPPGSAPLQPQHPLDHPDATGATSGATRSRAFVCPLFSCGRMFKRMEHLKRHLRTHTMEKPFSCNLCQKKFSRSDNLNQHLRTHDRAAGPGGAGRGLAGVAPPGGSDGGMGVGDVADWIDAGSVEAGDLSRPGTGSSLDARSGGEEGEDVGGESEELEEFEGEDIFGYGAMGSNAGEAGLGMFGGAAMGMGMGDFGANALGVHPTPSYAVSNLSLDVNMCEVEVPGEIHEISGDEEGLIMSNVYAGAQELSYYPGQIAYSHSNSSSVNGRNGGLNNNGMQQPTPEFDNWAMRPHPSPAFSAGSIPSPPQSSVPLIRSNRSSIASPPAGYRTHSPSSSASSSVFGGDDYVASLSAPSHKQVFDHAQLYQGMMDSSTSAAAQAAAAAAAASASGFVNGNAGAGGGGPGPIRRHRSMTPSVMRNGEPIRRPMTASSSSEYGAGGSPGTNSSMGMSAGAGGAGSRAYHPYAAYGTSSSRAGSAQSSPSVYPVPLAGEYGSAAAAAAAGVRRSESRNSSLGMQDQLRQFMNLSMDGPPPASSSPSAQQQQQHQQQQQQQQQQDAAATASLFGQDVYRTDSPFAQHRQTDSPAPYTTDLPPLTAFGAADASAAAGQGVSTSVDGAGFSLVQDQFVVPPHQSMDEDTAFYSHPHHSTL